MNKILSLLGFAAKAGKLSYGYEAVVTSLKTGKSKLVLIAGDISPKSRKEANFYAEKARVKAAVLNGVTIQDVTNSVGRKCGIISVNDDGFAEACLKSL